MDPQRDIQQYLDSAHGHGLTITHVFETHFHADFLSGHLELAKATGAEICFGSAARPGVQAGSPGVFRMSPRRSTACWPSKRRPVPSGSESQ